MSDLRTEFSQIVDALCRASRLAALRDERSKIQTIIRPNCGNCSHWMKRPACPREAAGQKPSCSWSPCPKHELDPAYAAMHAQKLADNSAAIAAALHGEAS